MDKLKIGRVIIPPSLKKYTLDQEKSTSPQKSLKKFSFFKKGKIVNDLIRLDTLYDKLGLPVYFCQGGEYFKQILGEGQWGKGITQQQAKVSAMMECWERFSWQFLIRSQLTQETTTINNLIEKNIPVVNPQELVFPSIKIPAGNNKRIENTLKKINMSFTEVFEVGKDKPVKYPFLWHTSVRANLGLASGNTLTEALLQGIAEIIEKHVSSLMLENPKSIEPIDVLSIKDEVVLETMEKFWQSQVKLHLFDISFNYPIPTILVLAEDTSPITAETRLIAGTGSASSKEKALLKALTSIALERTRELRAHETVKKQFPRISKLPNHNKYLDFFTNLTDNRKDKKQFSKVVSSNSPDMCKDLKNILTHIQKENSSIYCKFMDLPGEKNTSNPVIYWIVPQMRYSNWQMEKDDRNIYFFLARILATFKADKKAVKILDKAIGEYGERLNFLFPQALSLLNIGERGKARRILNRCIRLAKKEGNLAYIKLIRIILSS